MIINKTTKNYCQWKYFVKVEQIIWNWLLDYNFISTNIYSEKWIHQNHNHKDSKHILFFQEEKPLLLKTVSLFSNLIAMVDGEMNMVIIIIAKDNPIFNQKMQSLHLQREVLKMITLLMIMMSTNPILMKIMNKIKISQFSIHGRWETSKKYIRT